MSYPPYPPDPNRPQDSPPASGFPTYGRPEETAPKQNPYDRPQDPVARKQNPYDRPQDAGAPFVPPSSPVQGSPYQLPPPPPPYQGPQQYQGGQYPQFAYGYGYQGVQQAKTNGLAIAALVCGLVGVFISLVAPVAIGLGIAALVQIKRRQERGTGQAVAGLVLGSLITVVVGALTVFFIVVDWNEGTDDYGSDEPVSSYSATPTPDPVYADELVVGECFDEGSEEGQVLRQPCPIDHQGELIANVTLPRGAYPGDAKVQETARRACRAEFAKYVGVPLEKSVRKSNYWWPDESLWKVNNRIVICAVEADDGDILHGSVKGSKR
ncbi:DUF4190 domain-containing protein [Kribbella sp. NPDC006257]|uniref:DUF4190 domain-containing protein n=1 Tax=Kribbella sp. NPDC006257 TaxID=3156738 RepID=UPI0033BE9714